jgi:hypothetical protein
LHSALRSISCACICAISPAAWPSLLGRAAAPLRTLARRQRAPVTTNRVRRAPSVALAMFWPAIPTSKKLAALCDQFARSEVAARGGRVVDHPPAQAVRRADKTVQRPDRDRPEGRERDRRANEGRYNEGLQEGGLTPMAAHRNLLTRTARTLQCAPDFDSYRWRLPRVIGSLPNRTICSTRA